MGRTERTRGVAWGLAGVAGPALHVSWSIAIALFVVGFVIAFFVVAYALGRRKTETPEHVEQLHAVPAVAQRPAPPPDPQPEELPRGERVPEEPPRRHSEAPAPVAAMPAEDPRARLRAAFASGRITRDTYEANLRHLEPPSPVAAAVPDPVPEPTRGDEARARKLERLRTMYEEGRITESVYEENLRRVGGEAVPMAAAPEPASPVVARTADVEGPIAKLREAYESGRIPREAYRENLRRLGASATPEPEAPPVAVAPAMPSAEDKVARLRQLYESGRLPKAAYEENLRKLGVHVEAPAAPAPAAPVVVSTPVSPPRGEDKVARLTAAYAAGRVSREAYEANAKALGVDVRALGPPTTPTVVRAPVDDRAERLHRAYREGRLSRGLYERNVRALGAEPLPAEELRLPTSLPEERAPRIATAFENAFEASRTSPEVPVPAQAKSAPPPEEARLARVRDAYAAGRISRETYERNLRALGALEPVNPPPPAPPVGESNEKASPAMPQAPIANPPPTPPASGLPADFEERIDLLTRMFLEGKVTKEIYERNLARTYEAVDPRLAQLRVAFEEGRIPKDVYDSNVRRVLQARGSVP